MKGQTIIFDGHRLNDRFYVGEVAVGLPEFAPNVEDISTIDGSRFRGMRLGSPQIDVQLVAKPVRGNYARSALSDLMMWLHVNEPKILSLSSDNGLRRLCVPIGEPQIHDSEWDDVVSISFIQVDPALYGNYHEVSVPSAGTLTCLVGGDYPTKPIITTASAIRNSGTNQWGLRLDDGDILRVVIPVSTASRVSVDCGERICLVNGATSIPTLQSNWFSLTPGMHSIQNDQGSGSCIVSWYERWHR